MFCKRATISSLIPTIIQILTHLFQLLVRETLAIFFDGMRVKIVILDNKFRGTIQGLCGNFNGEIHDEFLIPEGCILENDNYFPEYYTITQNKSVFAQINDKRCKPILK